MNSRILAVVVALLLAGGAVARADDPKPAKPELTPAQLAETAAKLAPSLVRVEYTLQMDKGEAPVAGGLGRDDSGMGPEELINEERPLEVPGILVAPDKVACHDLVMHPRFIKDISVRSGEQLVKAKIAGVFKSANGVLLTLDQPLKGAQPLEFDPASKGPFLAVHQLRHDGVWSVLLKPADLSTVGVTGDGRKFLSGLGFDLVVDAAGRGVGVSMTDDMLPDDSWKGSPANWPLLTAEQLDGLTAALTGKVDAAVFHVKLHFRSPKKGEGPRYSRYDSDGGSVVEHHTVGVLVEPRKLLVLAEMTPKITARLERVEVLRRDGEPLEAKFSHTLTDYGCFVAALDKPLPAPLTVCRKPLRDLKDALLLTAEVRIQGEQRIVHYLRSRIIHIEVGWKRQLFPDVFGRPGSFVFTADGELVVMPIARREKVSVRERYARREMVPAAYLGEALADLAKNSDPDNIPLTEEQEHRLAWLGVELQPLDAELARANKVSDITNEGATGAMVSYVYPGSPAGQAGVQAGWIIIRLHAADQPKPIDVRVDHYEFGGQAFPWEQLDRVPDSYYDQIPTPWPSVENTLNRTLTDLGFGKTFKAEFFVDGKIVTKDFKIEFSPAHYDSAPKFLNKDLGLTVKDMTYEVRRYFQKKPDDAGVLVSKIEPGSRVSVAGLKPYEIITHVNDQAVKDVKEFEDLVKDVKGELRLSVKRMARGRLVKVDMAAPAPKPKSQPDRGPRTISVPPPDGIEE